MPTTDAAAGAADSLSRRWLVYPCLAEVAGVGSCSLGAVPVRVEGLEAVAVWALAAVIARDDGQQGSTDSTSVWQVHEMKIK